MNKNTLVPPNSRIIPKIPYYEKYHREYSILDGLNITPAAPKSSYRNEFSSALWYGPLPLYVVDHILTCDVLILYIQAETPRDGYLGSGLCVVGTSELVGAQADYPTNQPVTSKLVPDIKEQTLSQQGIWNHYP